MANVCKKEKNQQIQVFIRVRPLNKQEGNANVVELKSPKEMSIKHHSTTRTYSFDRVFGPTSKQIEVYKMVAEPTVAEVIAGYNCTVLAYGQTGTGKTYTMAGGAPEDVGQPQKVGWMEDVHAGIIPRTLAHMFDELRVQQLEFTVRVSYLELYNEEIFDLLSPGDDTTKLKLYDDSLKKGSIIVQGLTETSVNTKADVYKILEKGAEKRRIAATLMNSQSSRSHTVFCITVHTKENSIDGEDLLKTGKLYLVDLAGSENIKQSGATDMRAREAFNINQSLLTLGRCIVKLTERSAHIPYRESKLTRLLQDSLGGRTKTTLIATVSPAFCNADESMNTLEYALRAKNITNKPVINQRLSKKTLLKEYTDEIERLRKDLIATKNGKGIYLDEENYTLLSKERENHKSEIADKINMIRLMQDEMEHKEQLCDQLKMSLEAHQKELETKVEVIQDLECKLDEASKEICGLSEENEIKEFIVQKYTETEQNLKTTAKELISFADNSSADAKKLHDKLDTLSDIQKHNRMLCEQYTNQFNYQIDGINNQLRQFQDHGEKFSDSVKNTIHALNNQRAEFKNEATTMMQSLEDTIMIMVAHNDAVQQDVHGITVDTISLQADIRKTGIAASVQHEVMFKELVCPQIRMLKDHQQKQDEFMQEFIKNCTAMVAHNTESANTFMGKCSSWLIHLQHSFKQHTDVISTICNESDNRSHRYAVQDKAQHNMMAKHMDTITDNMIEINEKINIVKETVSNLRTTNDEHYSFDQIKTSEIFDDHDSIRRIISQQEENVTEVVETCVEGINDNVKLVKTTAEENNQMLDKMKETTVSLSETVSGQHVELENATIKFSDFSKELCDRLSDQSITGLDDQKSNIVKGFNTHIASIKKTTESCTGIHNDLNKNHGILINSVSDTVSDVSTDMKSFEQYISQMESTVITALDKCREEFRRLTTSKMKEYKQTGLTPQRKTTRYPRNVIETKPKEKLIEEYHKTRCESEDSKGIGEEEEVKVEDEEDDITFNKSRESRILSECNENCPVETNKAPSKDSSKDFPKDSPKDFPKDSPKDFPKDSPKDFPKDSPKDFPKDSPKDFPNDSPKDEQPKL